MDAQLKDRLAGLIKTDNIMLFMKGDRDFPQCGFSGMVTGILDSTGFEYSTYNILEDPEVREGLKEYSDWPTYPQLYVKGELIGGADIIREMYESNELLDALK